MRNPVARHDFNRSSVHTDKKKDSEPSIHEGMDEWETYKARMDEVILPRAGGSCTFIYWDEFTTDEDIARQIEMLCNAEYTRGIKSSGIC